MEDLNKHQLILIVLLITFVTSIATGIITFTLLSEAPVEVTQTINRVVEKTIERVVPAEGQPEKVITTVVVNEEDRVLDTIAKNEKYAFRKISHTPYPYSIFELYDSVIASRPSASVRPALCSLHRIASYAFRALCSGTRV